MTPGDFGDLVRRARQLDEDRERMESELAPAIDRLNALRGELLEEYSNVTGSIYRQLPGRMEWFSYELNLVESTEDVAWFSGEDWRDNDTDVMQVPIALLGPDPDAVIERMRDEFHAKHAAAQAEAAAEQERVDRREYDRLKVKYEAAKERFEG